VDDAVHDAPHLDLTLGHDELVEALAIEQELESFFVFRRRQRVRRAILCRHRHRTGESESENPHEHRAHHDGHPS
jgi:hypothetical protein